MINPERATADKILGLLRYPEVTEILEFSEGEVELIGLKITPTSPLSGLRLIDLADRFIEAEFLVAAIHRGIEIIIAGAGGAAHLPGMVAGHTIVPVIGVPIKSRALNGMDSLLSIVQMPGGIPVATMAIGDAGATNAGLFAVAMLARHDESLAATLNAFRAERAAQVRSIELEH